MRGRAAILVPVLALLLALSSCGRDATNTAEWVQAYENGQVMEDYIIYHGETYRAVEFANAYYPFVREEGYGVEELAVILKNGYEIGVSLCSTDTSWGDSLLSMEGQWLYCLEADWPEMEAYYTDLSHYSAYLDRDTGILYPIDLMEEVETLAELAETEDGTELVVGIGDSCVGYNDENIWLESYTVALLSDDQLMERDICDVIDVNGTVYLLLSSAYNGDESITLSVTALDRGIQAAIREVAG